MLTDIFVYRYVPFFKALRLSQEVVLKGLKPIDSGGANKKTIETSRPPVYGALCLFAETVE